MDYTGSLDDLQGINTYLSKVQELIDYIKQQHGIDDDKVQ